MPTKPLPNCVVPQCPYSAVSKGRCVVHAQQAWSRTEQVPRIRGGRLQRLRGRLFSKQPLCVKCLEQDRITLATIRDHVVPLAEGGVDDETNEQALCRECSDAKTAIESARGKRRNQR